VIIVSACLVGLRTRHDGQRLDPCPELVRLVAAGVAILICPEQLGGLSTPREPAEIVGGDGSDVLRGEASVQAIGGRDVTDAYLLGAQETLRIAKMVAAQEAILKDGSPACGSTCIYDGTFTHRIRSGMGVAAALLDREGIRVRKARDLCM